VKKEDRTYRLFLEDIQMYLLRNKVSHEYFGVDYEIIWNIATKYLPENKSQIDRILEQEP